jgi:hypothetical protein
MVEQGVASQYAQSHKNYIGKGTDFSRTPQVDPRRQPEAKAPRRIEPAPETPQPSRFRKRPQVEVVEDDLVDTERFKRL